MKQLWLARLARPDLIKAINIQKRLYRLTCYLNSTVSYGLKGIIGDPAEDLELSLCVAADLAGGRDDAKSTSGNFLVLTGPNTYFPLTWSITK